MSSCTGISPLIKTNFLGATVVSFSANVGWGISTGSMQVTIVEDAGESFNPPPIGDGVGFNFNGFQYYGLLQSWEESIGYGGKTYTVTLQTPHQVLSGTQVILKGVDDFDIASLGSNKFINLHLETRPRPFQNNTYFSYCNEVGATWKDLRDIIDSTSAANTNPWVFIHRGTSYLLDCGVLAGADNFRIGGGGSQIDVLTAIDKVSKILQKRIYLDLIPALGGGASIIKVRAHDTSVSAINANLMNQPSIGDIGSRLRQSTGYHLMGVGRSLSAGDCELKGGTNEFGAFPRIRQTNSLISQRYGIEASEVLSDILVTGANFQWLFEVIDEGGTNDEDPANPVSIEANENQLIKVDDDGDPITNAGRIRHYWGSETDANGNEVPIVSTGTGDSENFFVDVSAQNWFRVAQPALPGKSQYYNITVLEIRAAANSFESWYEFMAVFKPDLLRRFFKTPANINMSMYTPEAIWRLIKANIKDNGEPADEGGPDGATSAQATNKAMTEAFEKMQKAKADALGTDGLRAMHTFVQKFQSHYGRKFFVPIPPELSSCCSGGNNVDLIPGLEPADFGWAVKDGSGPGYFPVDTVLGLDWNSIPLELFKTDEGGVKGIIYYEKVRFEPESGDYVESRDQSFHVGIDFAKIPETHPYYVEKTKGGDDDDPGFKVWLGAEVQKIHDPCNLIGNGPGAVVETPQPLNLRAEALEGAKHPHGLRHALWMILLAEEKRKDGGTNTLTDEEREVFSKFIKSRPGGAGMSGLGLIPKAHMPSAAVVPFKDNKRTYPGENKWWKQATNSFGFPVHANADYRKDEDLTPWNYGGWHRMDEGGEIQVETATSNQDIVEQGSFSFTGTPPNIGLEYMGAVIGGGDPRTSGNLTSISCQVGVQGITTTVQFKTFTPNWGEWGEQRSEYVASFGRSRQQIQRAANLNTARKIQQQIRQLFIDTGINTGTESETAGPTGLLPGGLGHASESDFIFGFCGVYPTDTDGVAARGLDPASARDESARSTYAAIEPLRAALAMMSTDDNKEYRIRAGMSLDGLLRPYEMLRYPFNDVEDDSANDSMSKYIEAQNQGSYGQIIDSSDVSYCNPQAYGMNSEALNPFQVGNDIKRTLFGKEYPEAGIELDIDSDGSADFHAGDNNARPWTLKGPLVLTGWGLDVDGYPVPNKGVGTDWDPKDRESDFEPGWMHLQHKWKTGPVDLRWDEEKNVWTSKPANKLKIIMFELLSEFVNGRASAKIRDEDPMNHTEFVNESAYSDYNKITGVSSNDGNRDDFDRDNFDVNDDVNLFEDAQVGDVGFAYRDYDGCPYFHVVSMNPAASTGGGCSINETTGKVTDSNDNCYDSSKPAASQLIKYGQDCFPCTLEQTYKIMANNAEMRANGFCDEISPKAVNNFNFKPNEKQFLGHDTGNFGSERSGSDSVCIKWMEMDSVADELCKIIDFTEDGGAYGKADSASSKLGHMPCTLEETYNYWDFSRSPNITAEFNFTNNAVNDHDFNPYRKQGLIHKAIPRDKRDPLTVQGVPRVYWSEDAVCDIPKMFVAGDSDTPLELGVIGDGGGFACSLEQTYKWSLAASIPFGSQNNSGQEKNVMPTFNISKDDDSSQKGIFEASVKVGSLDDFGFNPVWQQNLSHVHYKLDADGADKVPKTRDMPYVKWTPAWYASVPMFLISKDKTAADMLEYYYSQNLSSNPSIRPDYNLTKDAAKFRFGQRQFPMLLSDTFGHTANDIAEQSTYLGESNEEWGFLKSSDQNNFNYDPNKKQVLGHVAAGTKNKVDGLLANDKETPAEAADQTKTQAGQVWWMDVDIDDCPVPEVNRSFFPCHLWETYKNAPISWDDPADEPTSDFNYKPDVKQALVHTGGGSGSDFIQWEDADDNCDIADETSQPFGTTWKFGKDLFPCTLEETYKFFNDGGGNANANCNLRANQDKVVSSKAINGFNFKVHQNQALTHVAIGDNADGPGIQWKRTEECRINEADNTSGTGTGFTDNGVYGTKHFPCYLHELYGGAASDAPSINYLTAQDGGDVCENPGLEDFGWRKDQVQVLAHLKQSSSEVPDVSSKAGKIRWLKYSGCQLPGRVESLLPCSLEDTYLGASKSGTTNGSPNAPDINYQAAAFGFNIEEDQYLAHYKSENNNTSGLTTAKVRWANIPKICDIPATNIDNDTLPGTPTSGKSFGKGCFPCTLEETYRYDEANATPGQEPYNRFYEDEDGDGSHTDRYHSHKSGENSRMGNSYDFNPNKKQYLGHLKAGGDDGSSATEGPCIKWMELDECCVLPDKQNQFPCKLEDTYLGAPSTIWKDDTCKPTESYGYSPSEKQFLGHEDSGGIEWMGVNEFDCQDLKDCPSFDRTIKQYISHDEDDDEVKWVENDPDSVECGVTEADQDKYPCHLWETYKNSGADFGGQNNDENEPDHDFNWNTTYYQDLTNIPPAMPAGPAGETVRWMSKVHHPWVSKEHIYHPGQATPADAYPGFLWQTMEDASDLSPEWQDTANFIKVDSGFIDCGFDSAKVQVLGHVADSGDGPRIVWINVQDCDIADRT